MNAWQCCRTCLSENSLNPIFHSAANSEKYTNTIFSAIRLKITPTDNLPQTMCSTCILSLNQVIEFQTKCLEAHKELQKRLTGDFSLKTNESLAEDTKYVTISIKDEMNDHFNENSDHEDNIPLHVFQYNYKSEKTNEVTQEKKKLVKSKKKREDIEQEIVKKKIEKVRIECEQCHKILTSRTSLRNHYKIHNGYDFVCEHCGKKFITKRLLLMHCKAKHGYEKTDKCSFCDYTASNAEQVKIHERLHTGEKPYVCGECNAGFHRKSSYLQHVAIHLPEKTVQCDLCPALFKSTTLMRIHKNRHRPPSHKFVCVLCDGAFVRRRNATRHIQRAHRIVATGEHVRKVAVHSAK